MPTVVSLSDLQEVPVSVANELLDSALNASIEVPVVAPGLPVPSTQNGYVLPALILMGLAVALLLVRGWRQAAPVAVVESEADRVEVEEVTPQKNRRFPVRPPRKSMTLPPHVLATLDRLAQERAAADAASAESREPDGEKSVPGGGIEYWVGR